MRHAFLRAGVASAALVMLVSGSASALARPSHVVVGQSSEETKTAVHLKARFKIRLPLGANVVRASWYGGGERLNALTASGERFNPMARTAAHRSLPLGTKARIVNLVNGRTTLVKINDRGPAAWTGRSLDLSKQAAIDLGMIAGGETRVKMQILR